MKAIKDLRVLITTCNRYTWALEPFAYLFNKYWSPKQQVVVGCFAPPSKKGIKLPDNFTIHQIQENDVPLERRSDGLIKFFIQVPDNFFVWMLEDFWLVDKVDVDGIALLYDYMREHRDVLRVDLTRDRITTGKKYGKLGHLDLILSPTDSKYNWSHQTALWNKNIMLRYMRKGEGAPGEPIEPRCTRRVLADPNPPKVLGTRNWPVPYAHTIWRRDAMKHRIHLNGKPWVPVEDIAELRELGMITPDNDKFAKYKIRRRGDL